MIQFRERWPASDPAGGPMGNDGVRLCPDGSVLPSLSPWMSSLPHSQWHPVENIQSNHVPPLSRTFHSLPPSLRPQKPCGRASSPLLSASSWAAPGTGQAGSSLKALALVAPSAWDAHSQVPAKLVPSLCSHLASTLTCSEPSFLPTW